LPQIQCPVLIVQGEDDEFGTLDQVNRITTQISGAESLILPKTQHNPHKESPEEVLKCTADFIQKIIKS
jgi:pimeloyl-ACP methyl ester carboxylesterase